MNVTTGYCNHCRRPGLVFRYRVADLGLRYFHADCRARLNAMGLHTVPVTDADPRDTDRGLAARRRPGIGHRLALRLIRLVLA